MPRMPEMQFVRGVPKHEQNRIKHFLVQRDKFLDLTGLIAEGHYGFAFDPDYAFSRADGRSTYYIPADIMDAIVSALEKR